MADLNLRRAESLVREEAGSAKARDDALATALASRADLEVARRQRRLLGASVNALGGQRILWVRVPVLAGDAGRVKHGAPATIRIAGATGGALVGRPIAAPPSANGAVGSVDLYFALPNRGLRLGQRVAVSLQTTGTDADARAVPASAIVYDVHGGEWGYVRIAPRSYERRRVAVARVENGSAMLGSDDLYLANASAGLMSAPVLDAVIGHLRREAEVGAGQAAIEARERLEAGYAAAARLIGADPGEVAMLDSGNHGMQQLIQSVPLAPGDHVLVDRTCWCATLDMLRDVKGIVVDVNSTDDCGRVDVEATRAKLHSATRLVILTWCPATAGTVNPAAEVDALAASIGAWYFLDACQMLGQRPIDVETLDCHGLTASGRKWLRGPRGTSLFFASRAFLDATEAYMPDQVGSLRSDARRYEQGEGYIAGRIGFGIAIEGALAIGLSRIHDHLSGTTSAIRARLSQVPGVELVGQDGEDLSALVTFTLTGHSSIAVGDLLAARGIVVNTPLASYSPYDMAARGLEAVVRVAPQIFTTASDVDRLVEALTEIALAPKEG